MILLVYLLVVIFFILTLSYQAYNYIRDGILFQPTMKHVWSPDASSYSPEEVWISNKRIHGWFFQASKGRPVILFCHGNTGNISHRKYVIELCRELDLSLFIFDYRGYGYSKGISTLNTICEDGESAYKYLNSLGYTSDDIIVWGESLGGAVAVHVAYKYPCNRLLLMATFSSLSDLAWDSNRLIGKVAYPFLLWDDCSNKEKISKVECPVFIAHSIDDDLIPYKHSERLYDAIPHNWKVLAPLKGKHGTPIMTIELFKRIMEFSWLAPEVPCKCQNIFNYIAEETVKHGC